MPAIASQKWRILSRLVHSAGGPITFTCATLGSGARLGADRDEDGIANATDCAPADALEWAAPSQVTGVQAGPPGSLAWDAQVAADGVATVYDVVGGDISTLATSGFGMAACLAGDLAAAQWVDVRSDPPPGDGYYYQVRARKPCGSGGFGPGREVLDALSCSP